MNQMCRQAQSRSRDRNFPPIFFMLGKEAGGVTNRWQEQFGYAYDAAGNLNIRTNNALVQNFNVNSLNELTTITNNGRLTVAGSTTSPATDVKVNTSNAVIYADVTFASTNQPRVNGNNTFTAIAQDSYGRKDTNSITVNLPGTNTCAYDLNGNLLTDGTRSFAYDDENQLVSVWKTNAWRSDYSYDGKMRRRIVKEFTWSGSWVQTNETRYVYDGNLPVQERGADNLPLVSYTRGNDLSGTLQGAGGIGGLLARTDNSKLLISDSFATALYHADGNGNVTCLIFTNQMVAAKYLYDPYGNTLSQYGTLADANSYRFSSKEWNQNSGLYYYLYRFYDGSLQRWVNRDLLGEYGFEIIRKATKFLMMVQEPNLYKFVANSPVKLFDTFGLDPNSPECKKLAAQLAYHSAVAAYDESFGNYQGWTEEAGICMQLGQMMQEAGCFNPPPPPAPSCPAPTPPSRGWNPPSNFKQNCELSLWEGLLIMVCGVAAGVLATP